MDLRPPDTDRLTFRRFTPADVDNVLTLFADPEVMRFLEGRTRGRAEVESAKLPELLEPQADGLGRWATETVDGTFVGWFSAHGVTPSDGPMEFWSRTNDLAVVSIGYRLRRAAWGHGYGAEGARALVRWAFSDLGAREVVASTMAVNVGSRRVMERAGLCHVRTLHLEWPDPLPGTEHGEVEYTLRREDWVDIRAARPEEASALTGIVLRSKAHWGYDDAFMAAVREELTLTSAELEHRRVFVVDVDGKAAGVASLDGDPPEGELGLMFVDPAHLGRGLGKRLYRHLTDLARGLGFAALEIHSDPNAEPFYAAMGAKRIGTTPSGSIPGRELPVLRVDLTG